MYHLFLFGLIFFVFITLASVQYVTVPDKHLTKKKKKQIQYGYVRTVADIQIFIYLMHTVERCDCSSVITMGIISKRLYLEYYSNCRVFHLLI
jgi:hypothetical protein